MYFVLGFSKTHSKWLFEFNSTTYWLKQALDKQCAQWNGKPEEKQLNKSNETDYMTYKTSIKWYERWKVRVNSHARHLIFMCIVCHKTDLNWREMANSSHKAVSLQVIMNIAIVEPLKHSDKREEEKETERNRERETKRKLDNENATLFDQFMVSNQQNISTFWGFYVDNNPWIWYRNKEIWKIEIGTNLESGEKKKRKEIKTNILQTNCTKCTLRLCLFDVMTFDDDATKRILQQINIIQ